ncbi:hypothetical protein Landi51_09461 [Colletotrichum acutatum]
MLSTLVEESDLLDIPLGFSERRDGCVLGLFWAAGGRETLPHDLGVKLRHLELDYSFEKSVEEEDQAERAIVTMGLPWVYGVVEESSEVRVSNRGIAWLTACWTRTLKLGMKPWTAGGCNKPRPPSIFNGVEEESPPTKV